MQQINPPKHIKVVHARLADGSTKVFRHHRRTGQKIEGEPGTPELLRYEAASRSAIRSDTETLAGLIARYKRASEFSDLAPQRGRIMTPSLL